MSAAPRRHRWAALLVLVPVAALCLLGRFDGLYGQDPYFYFDYATGPARASLLALKPLPPFFWPPGYPLLVAAASLFLGITPLAGQLVSLVMGAAAVLFTGLLAEEVWSHAHPAASRSLVPWAASLLMALHPQLWQSSAVVMADTTGLAAAALGAWSLARYARVRHGRWLALSAAGIAFAILARWIYGFAALACAAFALSVLLRRDGAAAAQGRPWRHAAGAAVAGLLVLSPLLAPAAASPIAPTVESAPFAGSFQVYSWHPLNALRREFTTTDGLLRYRLPNGLYYALAPFHRYYFTPLLGALLLPGLWTALTRAPRALWWLLLWAALVWAFHAGAPWQNFRFTLAYLTPLAVVAAVGLATVLAWLGPRWRLAVLAAFGLGLGALLFGAVTLTNSFIQRKQADLQTVAAVEAQLLPAARLLTFNLTFTFQHYSHLDTHELYYLSTDQLTTLLADGRPTYLLVDAANIETQWGQEPLGATFHWLRDDRGLAVVDTYGPLTLWRVQ